MQVRSQGWEDPLEKEIATHSSILAWKIPWTEKPGGLQLSMGSQRVGHGLAIEHARIWTGKGLVPSTIDMGFVPLHGEGNGNPLQYSCLGNPMDRVWWATAHEVARVGHDLATER